MEFTFHGGAGEVGRSCIEVDNRFLFDAGLKITEDGSEYPLMGDCDHIKAVFLSHAHLDHSGALPLFNKKGLRCGVFCNGMTRDTCKILLKDSYHIDLIHKQVPIYTKENLASIISFMEHTRFGKTYEVDGAKFSFHYAGHIPGAASIVLEIDGRKILYTGDFNTIDTNFMGGAKYDFEDIDVMISEATYGDRDHPERKKEEKDFVDQIKKTLASGGSVLIPAFAVGRAQEVFELLNKHNINVPIYLDGMAKQVSKLYRRKPEYITQYDRYVKSLSKVKLVKNWKERQEIARKQCIIITTSGMMDGGPVIDYLGYFYHNEKNSILLTGYQAEGSNGRFLLEEGKVFIDGNRVNVKAFVKKYDFSAHAGRKELVDLINKVNPRVLILQHGDVEPLESLEKEFKSKCKVIVPKLGETIDI